MPHNKKIWAREGVVRDGLHSNTVLKADKTPSPKGGYKTIAGGTSKKVALSSIKPSPGILTRLASPLKNTHIFKWWKIGGGWIC